MALSRRNVLIGLGTVVAGSGAVLGTGAFTTVTAARTVSVETSGDASAFLALTPGSENGGYVDDDDATIEIQLDGTDVPGDGLNQDATTTIEGMIDVANNGSGAVRPLSLSMTDSNGDVVSDDGDPISFTSGQTSGELDTGEDILDSDLGSGSSVEFGMVFDLTGSNSLPDGDYTLDITAESA